MLALFKKWKTEARSRRIHRVLAPSDLRSSSNKEAVTVLSLSPPWPSLIHLSPNRQVPTFQLLLFFGVLDALPLGRLLHVIQGPLCNHLLQKALLSPPGRDGIIPLVPAEPSTFSLPSHQDPASVLKGSTLCHENLSRLGSSLQSSQGLIWDSGMGSSVSMGWISMEFKTNI